MIPLKTLRATVANLRKNKQHASAARVDEVIAELADLRIAVAQAEFLFGQLVEQDAVRLPFPRWNEVRATVRRALGLPDLPVA